MQILRICRSVVRQLGKPALLAATYKGDAAGIAFAAMEEVEGTLVNCLRELERLSLLSAGKHLSPFHCMYPIIFPSVCPCSQDNAIHAVAWLFFMSFSPHVGPQTCHDQQNSRGSKSLDHR